MGDNYFDKIADVMTDAFDVLANQTDDPVAKKTIGILRTLSYEAYIGHYSAAKKIAKGE